jgi:hypothetical protein
VSNGCLYVCMYVCMCSRVYIILYLYYIYIIFILYLYYINIIYRTDQQHQPKIKVEVEGMTHSLRLLYC